MEFADLITAVVIALVLYSMLFVIESFLNNKTNIGHPVYNKILLKFDDVSRSRFKRNSATYIKGEYKGYHVEVDTCIIENKNFLKIMVHSEYPLKTEFLITKESAFKKENISSGHNDFLTGDKAFDEKMYLYTLDKSFFSALLSYKMRKKIFFLALEKGNLEITNESIIFFLPITRKIDAREVLKTIDTAISLNMELKGIINIKEMVIENIRNEVSPGVKVMYIRSLVERFRNDTSVKILLSSLLENNNIAVQVEAAKHLEKKGMKHLVSVLKSEIKPDFDLLSEIIIIFGTNNYKESTALLKKLFNDPGSYGNINSEEETKNLKIEVLKCIEIFGDKTNNKFLLGILDETEKDILVHAVKALGTCGTVDAVRPLYKVGKSTLNTTVKNMVQKSIAKIQSRLGNVDKGWLSTVEFAETDGALSISEEASEGALSVEKDDG